MDREGTTVLRKGARDEAADPSLKPGTDGDTPARPLDPDRMDPSVTSLRHHTARGTLINSAFQIGLYGLATLERIAVAVWLTRSEYGMWGVLMFFLLAVTCIKNWGIAHKYV